MNFQERIYRTFSEPVSNDLLRQFSIIEALKAEFTAFGKLEADEIAAIESYEDSLLVTIIYNSNSIEGSTLTLGETDMVLSGELISNKPAKFQYAARGIDAGMSYLSRALSDNLTITETLIKDTHERVAADIDVSLRGMYRTTNVYIRGSNTVPVNPYAVRELMPDLLYNYKRSEQHFLWRIAAFHMLFENIHPFTDSNGRTGRCLMNFMLEQGGYPKIAVKADSEGSYNQALEEWQVNMRPDDFFKLYLDCLKKELDERNAIVRMARDIKEHTAL